MTNGSIEQKSENMGLFKSILSKDKLKGEKGY